MTFDEMADELRKAGWQVTEPLCPANCKHFRMRGSGGVSSDGSGHSENFCLDCGYSSRSEWAPTRDPTNTVLQN